MQQFFMKNPPQGAAPGQLTQRTGKLRLTSASRTSGEVGEAHDQPDAQTE
jgi:hypothetical protein